VRAPPRARENIQRLEVNRPRVPSSAAAVVTFLVEVVGVTDLRRPQTWPVLGHAVTVWLHFIHGIVKAFLMQPSSAVVDELPDGTSKTVQASVGILVGLALLPVVGIVPVAVFVFFPLAVFDAVPMAETFVQPVYMLTIFIIILLSIPSEISAIWSQANTTTFEREDSERISEAQQQYVEGELTEDELEAELEAGLERGDE